MEKYSFETERHIKNLFGGTIRWVIIYIYNRITNKEKPNRKDFIIGPKEEEEDYLGHANTQYRNTISVIIATFVVFSLIYKLINTLF